MYSVSILIPTYNQAAFISRAVESALSQDYENIRIIISDDNSSDNTEQTLACFLGDTKIRYKKNTTNLGRVANYRQLLYEMAESDWVVNLDADDYFTNESFISQAINAIKAEGAKKVLFYQGLHLKQDKENESRIFTELISEKLSLPAYCYFLNYFENKHFSHMSTLYNRKDSIDSGFYQYDILSSDIFSILQLCINKKNGVVILTKTISGVWFMHGANISKTLSINVHLRNYFKYFNLYRQAIANDFNRLACYKWILNASKFYWLTYLNTLLKSLKVKL